MGMTCGFYQLRMVSNDTTVLVPVENADNVGLRKAVGNQEIDRLFSLLSDGKIDTHQNWKGRFKDNSDRMRTGSLFDVVEVLKSLTYLEPVEEPVVPREAHARSREVPRHLRDRRGHARRAAARRAAGRGRARALVLVEESHAGASGRGQGRQGDGAAAAAGRGRSRASRAARRRSRSRASNVASSSSCTHTRGPVGIRRPGLSRIMAPAVPAPRSSRDSPSYPSLPQFARPRSISGSRSSS